MHNTRRNKSIRKQVTRLWSMLQLQICNTAKRFGMQHFPPHYMTSKLLVNQSLQEGVSSERQHTLQLEYSLTVEVPRVSKERMSTLFISTKHLHWIVAAKLQAEQMALACTTAFAQKKMLCQSSSQKIIHPRDISFLCSWRKWFCILLSFCMWLEWTEKLQSNDLAEVDWSNGTNDF